jgi:hypothetical protein
MSLYHKMKIHKDKPEFWIMLFIAGVIICLSFSQTAKLAAMVGATEWYKQIGFAFLIEILFAVSLLIRANQRASEKHVPTFIHVGYYSLLGVITIINMTVLYQTHPVAGPFVGGLISLGMIYTESLFVAINTDLDQPRKKSAKQLRKEAEREIEEEKTIQEIQWMRWEAKHADPKLIKKARKAEKARKRIESGKSFWPWAKSEDEGLPEYFRREPEPTPEIEAEPVEPVIVQEKHTAEVVPIKRPIGFHVEMSNTETPEPATIEHPSNTPKSNTQKRQTSNTKKHQSLTKKEQAIQYVIGLIERDEDYSVTSVANTVGCARSTASLAIREAKEKIGEVKN